MSELTMTAYGTASLESVMEAIRKAPPKADVQFDFCYLRPTVVRSYRGYFDHCALGWSDKSLPDRHWPSAFSVATELEKAIGNTYQGWKGGYFQMSGETPLWVDQPEDCSGTAIVGVRRERDTVIIETRKVDF